MPVSHSMRSPFSRDYAWVQFLPHLKIRVSLHKIYEFIFLILDQPLQGSDLHIFGKVPPFQLRP